MNNSDLKGKWSQIKGEAQRKWGKLTNDDLDVIEGDREKLIGKLQERYDMSREEAEREVDSFRL
ncbi:CsbD family protein [Clostridium sp. D2Q-11]|uniref:CsbD family protein n=1 Tax=Anaeromonas frigoriresistens TaxID=2683708 RepID=A0A942UWF0_9FIRM|nr:CsbD family protein [Anaeromonas frigoriresistens]MBS4538069.1 CsbD family protein [Anaeromonas frigoriresistens]